MQKISALFLFILLVPATLLSQEYKQIADGIEYAEILRGTEKEPIRANLLRLDLTKVRLDVAHALDSAIGLETPSSIAKRHGAFAAINAGFFKWDGFYDGDPVGILKIDGNILSESYGNRIAIGINNMANATQVEFAHLKSDNFFFRGTINAIPISGINRRRDNSDTILYTPELHRSTLTGPEGTEYVVRSGIVREVRKRSGSSIIPADGFVISTTIGDDDKILKLNDRVRLARNLNAVETEKQAFFLKAEDIIAGVPQLIKDGKIDIPWEKEKTSKSFVETKHPRTAVAKLKDGKFLMITVDGRQPNHSVGVGLQELAEMLLDLGAMDAMNLDGGGSTTMFLNGETKNKPSDKEGERKVSDVILVTLRKK